MADKFSLDDILAEVDKKKATRGQSSASDISINDILSGKESKSADLSVTTILAEEELKELEEKTANNGKKQTFAEKNTFAEQKKASAEQKTASADKKPVPAKEKPVQKPAKQGKPENKEKSKVLTETPVKKSFQDKTVQFFRGSEMSSAEDKTARLAELDELSKNFNQESGENKLAKKEKKALLHKDKHNDRFGEKVAVEPFKPDFKPKFAEDEDDDGNDNFEISDDEVDTEKFFGKHEKTADMDKTMIMPSAVNINKHIKKNSEDKNAKLLKRDIAAENPDDLLDLMNPYELKSKADTAGIDAIAAAGLAGDTIGVAGNELKELAKQKKNNVTNEVTMVMKSDEKPPVTDNDTAEIVREYKKGEKNGLFDVADKEKRSTTALIDSINKNIAKKRSEDIAVSQSLSISEISTNELKTPTLGLNIDYNKQIIPDTGVIPPISDIALSEAKIKDLASKRKRKIRDFVLEDIDDEPDEDDDITSDDEVADYDSYDGADQIRYDLNESHRGLKTRFIILLIITAILGIVTFASDFGNGINLNFFGNQITMFNKSMVSKEDPSFLYMNLVAGVLGLAVCSSVILNGISKLLKGKADCDSICAVSAVVAILGAILPLENPDYIQRSRAFIYISVGLMALLFNTLGKLSMIVRAKRNFAFVSGDYEKYFAYMVENEQQSEALTKGIVSEIPVLVSMRKTEFLTDFLKTSYCTDKADKISRYLTPIALAFSLIMGLVAYFVPNTTEGMSQNIYWALTVGIGTLSALSPFSMMFIVNRPLSRASKALAKSDSAILGYAAVEDFSETNSIVVDAKLLFPIGSVACKSMKPCHPANSVNNIALDQAIILAASLAIKSGSVMSHMFDNMINHKSELLAKIDNCVYEDDMGVMGWYGNKRLMLGSRDQMKHHDIKVPDVKKTKRYRTENTEIVYLAVGGEIVIMFLIEMSANAGVKAILQEMTDKGISVAVKTTDSLVTVGKLADVFDIPPEMIKILPYALHEQFDDCSKYVSRGCGAISCSGTFTSFGRAILSAKKLMKSINLSACVMIAGLALAAIFSVMFALFVKTEMFSPSAIMLYNFGWMVLMLFVQQFKRY